MEFLAGNRIRGTSAEKNTTVGISATGGTKTTNTSVTPNRIVHKFLLADTGTDFEVTGGSGNIQILVVGAGGGGGSGGGGGGGVVEQASRAMTVGTTTITVGTGGTGGSNALDGTSGGNSVFANSPTITAIGGGFGAKDNTNSGNGGSGGGA